jgi:hypothetical protein
VREARICPVLSGLLPYFEKDEARHVGLGTQVLPLMMRRMNRLEGARLTAFALKVTFWLLASNRAMDPALRQLGLDPRRLLVLAKSKQMIVWEEVWGATNKQVDVGDAIARVMEAVASGLWPPEEAQGLAGRARAFARAMGGGVDQVPTSIAPDA